MSLLFQSQEQGARRLQISLWQKLLMFFSDNMRQAVSSLGELSRARIASLMTIAVLSLSITLPTGFYVVVKNLDSISADWQRAAEVSLFLKSDVSSGEIQQLLTRLRSWPEINNTQFISAEQALAEFTATSGLGDVVQHLTTNPLPRVVLVYPTAKHTGPTAARLLLDKLLKEREVELGKLDIQWLERLHAIVNIARELVFIVGCLLFVAVVLTVGNTIRLNIYNKRDEILVMKLVGATDGFIQRPFLYTGFWYGFLGGLLAWLTLFLMLWWVSHRISAISSLYDTSFALSGLDLRMLLSMLGISVALGLGGAHLSVRQYVSQIEPT